MKTILSLLLFLALFQSCSNRKNTETENENSIEAMKTFKPNKDLVEFKIVNGLSDEQVENIDAEGFNYLNSKEFNPKTDTIKYNENEIYVSYLTFLTSGPIYKGDFQIKNDSLILELKPFYDEVMTEESAERVIFKIRNVKNKKYKVGKGI